MFRTFGFRKLKLVFNCCKREKQIFNELVAGSTSDFTLVILAFQSKYIGKLLEKAKEREREHDIIYERKIAKERSKDDHLFADKDKFVTGAYKRKLAEQAKWQEEERLRQLREERDDVSFSYKVDLWLWLNNII